jgi:hypothetical protein
MSETSSHPLSTGSSAEADLALIRRALNEAARTAAMDGRYLVLWGLVLTIAQGGTFAAYQLFGPAANQWINYLWYGTFLAGFIGSVLLGFSHRHATVNLAVRLYRNAWQGLFLTLVIVAATAASGRVIQFVDFMVIAPVITGLAFYVSSAVTGFGWLRWLAVAWWAAGLLFGILGPSAATGLLAVAVYLGLMALPGYLIIRQGRSC